MKRLNKVNIKDLNTFNIPCVVDTLFTVKDINELNDLIEEIDFKQNNFYILGEGSNSLFRNEFVGVIVKDEIKGVEVVEEDEKHVKVKFGSGEIWRDLVIDMSKKGYSGIENLAYIPGTIGAALVQNIGAYGQVVEDVVHEVETFDLSDGSIKTFTKNDCDFSYRHSIFKDPESRRYMVISVTLKLNKFDSFDLSYHSRYANESLKVWLEKNAKEPYKPIDIANAVTDLRKYKLPWIDEYGTCGSFFVNPFVRKEKYDELAKIVPDLQCYPVTKMDYSKNSVEEINDSDFVKIPAGRLLDELGWKGKWIGNVGTFDLHALCVVTNKKAKFEEVRDFVDQMKKDVLDRFGVELKEEVVQVE